MRPWHLFLAGVKDHKVADQVEQPRLVAQLRQRPVQQHTRRTVGRLGVFVFPFDKELLRRASGAVAQPLRIAARQHQLHRAEKALVEDVFLVGDELAHAVGQLHRAALELDHRDGEAVEIEHDVRPPLVAARERHLLGQREIVLLRVRPVDQVHRLVRLPRGDLHRHTVAQELVGAQVRLVERDARRVGGGLELLQRGGNVGGGVAAGRQVVAQQRRLDAAVVLALVPLTEVAVAEVVGPRRVGEQGDDAVLRLALGARDFFHEITSQWPPLAGPTRRRRPIALS